MEEVNQPIVDSQKNNTPEVTSTAQNKPSTFLVSLLSILLLISVFMAGFFAYQTQKLVKELTKLRNSPSPTVIATSSPVPSPSETPTVEGSSTPKSTMVACTMDAKICPDGSAVGRSGPKCEFEACPTSKP